MATEMMMREIAAMLALLLACGAVTTALAADQLHHRRLTLKCVGNKSAYLATANSTVVTPISTEITLDIHDFDADDFAHPYGRVYDWGGQSWSTVSEVKESVYILGEVHTENLDIMQVINRITGEWLEVERHGGIKDFNIVSQDSIQGKCEQTKLRIPPGPKF